MPSRSDAVDIDTEEPKDRTKWMWLSVLALFVIMVLALWLWPERPPIVSQVLAKHILIRFDANDPADRSRALQLAEDIRKRLLDGESFGALATQYSNDPYSSGRGGSLGWSTKGQYDQKVEDYIWTAPVGAVSEVIQTAYGFHLVVVIERRLSKVDQYEQEQKAQPE